ncbi:MAG: YdcF family protein, partial [Verrucomicrobiota bacterium]
MFEERIRHGVDLWAKGIVKKLLFTGGVGEGDRLAESEVAELFSLGLGASPGDIIIEKKSRKTRENLFEAMGLMNHEGLETAVIVSDPLHLKRAAMMAEDLGMNVVTSPTPTSRYRGVRVKFKFLLREVYFCHHYWVLGD